MIQDNPNTSWMERTTPKVHRSAYVHDSASVIGNVEVGADVFIGPNASIRGDEGFPIKVGDGSNVQDGAVMHSLKGQPITIGKEVCVAHLALIHGPCEIGDHSFIGFGAKIFKANLGSGCFVSTGALVTGVDVPAGKFIPDMALVNAQEKVIELIDVPEPQKELATEVVEVNKEFAKGYKIL